MRTELRPEVAGHTLKSTGSAVLPLVGVVLPCYNEELNIDELYSRLSAALAMFSDVRFQICFIDNASTDGTVHKCERLLRGIGEFVSSSMQETLGTSDHLFMQFLRPRATAS